MPARDSLWTRCYFSSEKKKSKAANLSSASAAVKRLEWSKLYRTLLLLKAKEGFFLLFQLLQVCTPKWQNLHRQVLREFPTTIPCNGTV